MISTLSSCGNIEVMKQSNFFNVTKNITADEFKLQFDRKAAYIDSLIDNRNIYKVFMAIIQTGYYKFERRVYRQGKSEYETVELPLYNQYYFIFKNNKPFYSGFMFEFTRLNEPEIQLISSNLLSKIQLPKEYYQYEFNY